MNSFISDSQRGSLEAPFSILHNTFGRNISMFKNGTQITISTNANHDYIWESAPQNDQFEVIPISGIFKARILYGKVQARNQFNSATQGKGTDQLNIELDVGDVRIKLDPTGAAFISDATRVILDGDIFNIETPKRPHGLFNPQFYDFILKRLP